MSTETHPTYDRRRVRGASEKHSADLIPSDAQHRAEKGDHMHIEILGTVSKDDGEGNDYAKKRSA